MMEKAFTDTFINFKGVLETCEVFPSDIAIRSNDGLIKVFVSCDTIFKIK